MIFKYVCDCGHENSFHIHNKRVTDFYCMKCDTYIGSSNSREIMCAKPLDISKNFYEIIEEPRTYTYEYHTGTWGYTTGGYFINDDLMTSTTDINYYTHSHHI